MIKFSNGHTFEYMAASGALGFDGKGWWWERPLRWFNLLDISLFTSVIKTLTRHPLQGNFKWYNPLRCIRPISGGVVNAVGLTNPGIDWWRKHVGPSIDSAKVSLVGSIFGKPEELKEMAKMLNDFDLVGLEINTSCPSVQSDLLYSAAKVIASCEIVKRNSRLPLILKISVGHNVEQIIKRVESFIEAISINSVPWVIAFPNRRSSLSKFGGGAVSGRAAQPWTWSLVKKLAEMSTIPVIGPSVWNFDDLEKVRNLGAKAVSFGSVFLRCPWRPTLYVRREQRIKQSRV